VRQLSRRPQKAAGAVAALPRRDRRLQTCMVKVTCCRVLSLTIEAAKNVNITCVRWQGLASRQRTGSCAAIVLQIIVLFIVSHRNAPRCGAGLTTLRADDECSCN